MVIEERCGIGRREPLRLDCKSGDVREHHGHNPFHRRDSPGLAATDQALHQRSWDVGRKPAQARLHGIESCALRVKLADQAAWKRYQIVEVKTADSSGMSGDLTHGIGDPASEQACRDQRE